MLAAAYLTSMELVYSAHATSIAFPAISAGVYGYPLRDATAIAVASVGRSLREHPMIVRFVLFSDTVLAALMHTVERFTPVNIPPSFRPVDRVF